MHRSWAGVGISFVGAAGNGRSLPPLREVLKNTYESEKEGTSKVRMLGVGY